jgi:hypothetical protein
MPARFSAAKEKLEFKNFDTIPHANQPQPPPKEDETECGNCGVHVWEQENR